VGNNIQDNVSWIEPVGRSRRKFREACRRALREGFIVRVARTLLLVIPAVVLVRAAALRMFPGLEFDWIAASLVAVAVLPLLLGALLLLYYLFPDEIIVSRRGVAVYRLNMLRMHRYDRIEALRIESDADNLHALHFTAGGVARSYGIPPDVDLPELASRLEQYAGRKVPISKTIRP
jgi:hypothetical protein